MARAADAADPADAAVRPIALDQVIATATPRAIALWLEVVPDPVERAAQLAELGPQRISRLGALLDADTGEELLSTIDTHAAGELLTGIAVERAGALLDVLNSDLAADILRDLEPEDREPLLAAVPVLQADVLRSLLAWPEHSTAAHMIPDVLTVPAGATAAAAVDGVRAAASRRRADSQSGGYVYVVDGDRHLVGVAAFRALVLAAADARVDDLMDPDVLAAAPLDDPEQTARMLQEHRLLAVPVVDGERRLLGVLTADAAADIAEEEATEDAEL